MLRTLDKTTWEEIKVGEVFAWEGQILGWIISHKVSDTEFRDLTVVVVQFEKVEGEIMKWKKYDDPLYKLPKIIQRSFM